MEGLEIQPHISLRKGQVEPVCIIVGDPARTEAIANMCEKKQELAFCREYRTFAVEYEGQRLTVISHGIGCPGCSICCEELIHLGAKVLIRAGTCGSLRPDTLKQGDICIPYGAANDAGYVRNILPEGFPCICSQHVFQTLMDTARELNIEAASGIAVTQDQFYQSPVVPSNLEMWAKVCDVVEMEMTSVLAVAHIRGVQAGGILAVDGSPLQWREGDYDPTGERTNKGKKNMIRIVLKAAAKLRREYATSN
ncbi:Purine nucleoside phosphorylase [Besnoitia besnoiti]|uniref:Purine nucleoside phosphorylase n=1 Tax=Besnoitia besnoiti TaxID=94643 RepID=A0A2A9M7J5_BESBE|nr:Purine nucleoside phosphorylase [Besnoitia besnoiti]PFH33965.1 Purine nucleoside phosphorylase [Besnoitia besnoiti]